MLIFIWSLGILPATFAQGDTLDLCIQDFVDTNQDGLPTEGELIFGRGEVLLSSSDGTVVASLTITDGEDCMSTLQPGNYTLSITLPEGYTPTTETTLALTLTESTTINVGVVSTTPADSPLTNVEQNFICVLVFHDENRNGERESTEALIAGIDVNLVREERIIDTTLTNATDATCFAGLEVGEYQILIPASANHIMVSRRDIAVSFQDLGNEVVARFGAIPVNPLSDEARFPTVGSGELTLNNNTRLILSGVGAILAMFFMAGLGSLLYGLIRR